MRNNERVFLGFVTVIMVAVVVYMLLSSANTITPNGGFPVINPNGGVEGTAPDEPEVQPKSYVNIFFIGQNENKEEVYKAIKRVYDKEKDGSKIKFAMNALIGGPTPAEVSKGIYSEIPYGTRILFVEEKADQVVINLNSAFQTGGGTDSIYKRLYQIIKTANINTTKPVYLYIDGKKADVVGGEGIMLNQPLNDRSLED